MNINKDNKKAKITKQVKHSNSDNSKVIKKARTSCKITNNNQIYIRTAHNLKNPIAYKQTL